MLESERALREGRLEDVLERLERATFEDPEERARALALRGAAELRSGEPEKAAASLEAALALVDDPAASVQLAHALRYLGRVEEALARLEPAEGSARRLKDGALMTAVLCARGEAFLERGEWRRALHSFGQARGLSELSGVERLSVLPLAGLAEAQTGLGHRAKGLRNAEKALGRASGDRLGEARAMLALAVASGRLEHFAEAERLARLLPHRPLERRARRKRLERFPDAP